MQLRRHAGCHMLPLHHCSRSVLHCQAQARHLQICARQPPHQPPPRQLHRKRCSTRRHRRRRRRCQPQRSPQVSLAQSHQQQRQSSQAQCSNAELLPQLLTSPKLRAQVAQSAKGLQLACSRQRSALAALKCPSQSCPCSKLLQPLAGSGCQSHSQLCRQALMPRRRWVRMPATCVSLPGQALLSRAASSILGLPCHRRWLQACTVHASRLPAMRLLLSTTLSSASLTALPPRAPQSLLQISKHRSSAAMQRKVLRDQLLSRQRLRQLRLARRSSTRQHPQHLRCRLQPHAKLLCRQCRATTLKLQCLACRIVVHRRRPRLLRNRLLMHRTQSGMCAAIAAAQRQNQRRVASRHSSPHRRGRPTARSSGAVTPQSESTTQQRRQRARHCHRGSQ